MEIEERLHTVNAILDGIFRTVNLIGNCSLNILEATACIAFQGTPRTSQATVQRTPCRTCIALNLIPLRRNGRFQSRPSRTCRTLHTRPCSTQT